MKSFSKKPLALATAAVLGFGMASAAHAGAKAYSNLNVTDFRIFDANTNTQITTGNAATYFSSIVASNSGTNSAQLNGVPDSHTASSPGPIDPAQACVGLNCGGLAGFAQTLGFPPGAQGNFARSDSILVGTILDPTTGASAQAVAEAQLPIAGVANNTSANIGTSSRFTFVADQAIPIRIDFNATGGLHVQLLADSLPSSNAFASMNYDVTITDLTTGVVLPAFEPPAINQTRSLNGPGPADLPYSVTPNSFTTTTPTLTAGDTYQLSISHITTVSATQETAVPEPATLALMGAGLLGFGAVRRFRKA